MSRALSEHWPTRPEPRGAYPTIAEEGIGFRKKAPREEQIEQRNRRVQHGERGAHATSGSA